MKFSDIFLPKIARSDPKVRIEAVNKEKDAGLLKKVVDNDSDEEVRKAAAKRLLIIQAEDS
jgi:hypothetical protein